MKKVYNYFALLFMLFAFANISAQNTFFQEAFGIGDGYWQGTEASFAKYDNPDAFNFDTIPLFIRNLVPSTNYADASGENYVDMEGHFNWDGVTDKHDTLLLKVDTHTMGNVLLHFGLYNNSAWAGIRDHAVTIQYSTDASTWTDMAKTTTAQDTFPGPQAWGWVSLTEQLPSANNLYIMFINAFDNPHEYYLDDITLTGISTDATLSDLQVDGTTIPKFSGTKTFYRYYVPEGSTAIPAVTATATNPGATVEVTDATEIPGTSTVTVTAVDGETQWVYSILFSYPVVMGTETVLYEDFGLGEGYWLNPANTYTMYSGSESWSEDPILIRNTNPSTGYAAASGGGAMFLGPFYSGSDTVSMFDINTMGYTNMHLQFGFFNETGWPGIRNHTFNAAYSTDGETWTNMDKNFTVEPDTFPGNNTWSWVTLGEDLPAVENLHLMFWNPDANHGWQMDDITIKGNPLSSDATLANILINGNSLADFVSTTTEYDVQIPGGALPTIDAVVTDAGATAVVTMPDAVPGTATVTVTAEDG
ncbi:MAG TPA: cadherin-like beta sandwich domain-containing protein, partial [Bacteroidales bacterium]|nr:cadherin-like beta sandwich domain-containing protein [Bacteroidales bacterium]